MKKWISSEYMYADAGVEYDLGETRYYLASEVDAERAKDWEEIEKRDKQLEVSQKMIDNMLGDIAEQNIEIARLRKALEMIIDTKDNENPHRYNKSGIIAREALEGK
jgi:hypothetical protein